MEFAQNIWLFTMLLFGIIIVPGMDMLFVLTNALAGGRQAGFAAVGGIMLGGALHTLSGTLAVGVLSFVIPWLRNPLIVAGALYMIWIGWTLVRSAIIVDGVPLSQARSATAIFGQGLVTCLLNPKAYLFIMAVYPQFMKPDFGPLWPQAIVMGALTVLTQFLVYGSIAGAASRSRDFLLANQSATIWTGRTAGALLIAAAIWTAWQGIAAAV